MRRTRNPNKVSMIGFLTTNIELLKEFVPIGLSAINMELLTEFITYTETGATPTQF